MTHSKTTDVPRANNVLDFLLVSFGCTEEEDIVSVGPVSGHSEPACDPLTAFRTHETGRSLRCATSDPAASERPGHPC